MKNKLPELLFEAFYPMADFALVTFAIMFSYKVYRVLGIGQQVYYQKIHIISTSIAAALLAVFIMYVVGVYKDESSVLNVEEIRNTIKGITIAYFLIAIILVLTKMAISRYVLVLSYMFSLAALLSIKMIFYHFLPEIKLFSRNSKRVIIYGAGEIGKTLYRQITNSPKLRIVPVGFIDDDREKRGVSCYRNGFSSVECIEVLGSSDELDEIVSENKIDQVIIAISSINNDRLIEIIDSLNRKNIKYCFVPNLYKVFLRDMKITSIGDIPIVEKADKTESIYVHLKRYFDISHALFILIFLFPLYSAIAVIIKFDSKGPVLFKHNRVGKDGKIFLLYKFRSMYVDAEPYSINPMDNDDRRITRVGRILRKTSLDELPQIINVLKGDMSFVGPRPEMPFIVEQYDDIHRERLRVLPGITGLWQLSGDRNKAIHENIDYDLYYIKKFSFSFDIAILLETIFFAFRGR